MFVVLLIVAAWAACGVLSYGLLRAHFVDGCELTWDSSDDVLFVSFALLGPIDLIATLLVTGVRHGLRYRSGERRKPKALVPAPHPQAFNPESYVPLQWRDK